MIKFFIQRIRHFLSSFIQNPGSGRNDFCFSENLKKNSGLQSDHPNGFASLNALIVFLLILQICLYSCALLGQSAGLIAAARQSDFDLAVYDHARAMAQQNAYSRRCFLSDEKMEMKKTVEIYNRTVDFTDRETWIEARYLSLDKNRNIVFRLFYAENGLIDSEYSG